MDCHCCIGKLVISIFFTQVSTRSIADFTYWPGLCPRRLPSKHCRPNPCLVHKCPMRPDAICEPNTCGGCRADFFDKHWRIIPKEECYDFTCKPGLPVVRCSKSLKKRKEKCHAHPDAIFIGGSSCHTCGTYFKFGRRLLPHECVKHPYRIEHCNIPRRTCLEDPCKLATCNTTSQTLICVPNYCQCTYRFVDEFNRPIKCGAAIYKPEEITCRNGATRHQPTDCASETCDAMCRGDPEAMCVHECGSCNPVYVNRRGHKLGNDICQ